MKKSINKGTCQVCGAVQKIQNNGLNQNVFIHGFTKTNGWWNQNECFGSGHKALEVSCDMVENSIARAYDQRDRLRDQVTAQEETSADLIVYRPVADKWHDVHWMRGAVVSHQYEVNHYIQQGDVHTFTYQVKLPNGEVHECTDAYDNPNKHFRTEAECFKVLRATEINRLSKIITEINEYAQHQSEVINNWVAKPLIKI
jgi:hypothetical protein